jgi:hypothetical protein
MALGIGATTVLFSIVSGVLLKPLPIPEADRLIAIRESREGSTRGVMPFMTNGTYLAWQQPSETIDDLAGWSNSTVTMTDVGESQRVRIAAVTANFFPLLRATTVLGTQFTAADEASANHAVVSDGLWKRQFGGRSDVLGRLIRFNGRPYTIVGVMSPTFSFPNTETVAWIPFRVQPVVGANPQQRFISMLYGISPADPVSFLAVPAILFAVAISPASFRRVARHQSILCRCSSVEKCWSLGRLTRSIRLSYLYPSSDIRGGATAMPVALFLQTTDNTRDRRGVLS